MIQFKNFEMAKGGKEKIIIVNARNKCVETVISWVGEIASEKVYFVACSIYFGKEKRLRSLL